MQLERNFEISLLRLFEQNVFRTFTLRLQPLINSWNEIFPTFVQNMHRIEFKTNNYIKNLNNIYYNFEVFCVVFNQKTHRRYLNTQDTDIQTDNMCSVWMMNTAAGFCVFSVCNVYSKGFLRISFSNRFT